MKPLPLIDEVISNLPPHVAATVDRATLQDEIDMTPETAYTAERPRLYQVETTSSCNLRCPFCPRTTELIPNPTRNLREQMPLDKFTALLDQMPWVQSIEPFQFGEPFMTRDFHLYIQACTERGIRTNIATNLLAATTESIAQAFDAGLSMMMVDLDSLDAEKYAQIRVGCGPNGLARLREKLLFALAYPSRPFVSVQTILLDGVPEYEWADLLAWTGGVAPDELRYKFLDSFRGAIADHGGLGPHDLCREPFFGFTVQANGNVVPCNRDWGGEAVMGNVHETPVMEIWHGAKYDAFRAQMRSTEKPSLCRSCGEGRLINARSQPQVQTNMFRGSRTEVPCAK